MQPRGVAWLGGVLSGEGKRRRRKGGGRRTCLTTKTVATPPQHTGVPSFPVSAVSCIGAAVVVVCAAWLHDRGNQFFPARQAMVCRLLEHGFTHS